MTFTSDKLYNGYIRQNMAIIVSKVKPREIMMHLPCLTAHDRDVIEAKTDSSGHYNGMMVLLDCLKRRENWPEQFIEALEACEQKTIAADIRAEYNSLRADSNPNSSPATVVMAHVHPAPSASYLPIPESGGNSEAAVAQPAVAPAVQAPPPLKTPTLPQTPKRAADPVPKAISPPEPVPEPPTSTQIDVAHPPSTPPASPTTTRIRMTSEEREINFHQEPEENSESDIQHVTADTGAQVSSGSGAVSETAPQPPHPVEHHQDPPKTTIAKKSKEPESPAKAQINSDGTGGPSFYTKTPEKPPVQDSTPPFKKIPAPVPQPEDISEPPATQIVETATGDSPRRGAPLMETARRDDDDDDVCLSKPGQLVSVQPQTPAGPTIPASGLEAQPYSGNSDRLEISEAASDAASDAASSGGSTVDTVTPLPCQETGVVNLNHNEPEENQYESPCQSLETQEELVLHISEEPSIPNLDINGETTKEISPTLPSFINAAADSLSSSNAASKEGEEPADSWAAWTPHTTSPNTKFIVVAAGVGVCAMLLAWRFNK